MAPQWAGTGSNFAARACHWPVDDIGRAYFRSVATRMFLLWHRLKAAVP